jgi:predicted transglutaminase-like cysteine proteinase
MPVGKAVLITLILLLSIFSGCIFFPQTKFTLISLTLDDDEGFSRLLVLFNTTDTTTLTLTGPQKTNIFSKTFYYGIHNESIYIEEYRTNPAPGSYTLKAYDKHKNTVFENELGFKGQNLTITRVQQDGWEETTGSSLVALTLSVKNSGDLPAYPFSVMVHLGTLSSQARLTPSVIHPYHTKQLKCFVYLTPGSSSENVLNISVYNNQGEILAETTETLSPSDPRISWEYKWYYLGDQMLQLPNVDWFYDYYTQLERSDSADYASYVFDCYDDQYIAFVANQILSRTDASTDLARIDFVAAFVQSIEYTKDDPLNESYEYPRYPLETLKENRGDCEDKAILGAALLDSLGYTVSLLRLPTHMAVGVHLNETLPVYTYYIDQYYYLETTTFHSTLGRVPEEYRGLTNVTVYPISTRPLLIHSWKNATRFTLNNGEDYVQLKIIVENIGSGDASEFEIRGAFYDEEHYRYNQETTVVTSLAAGEKQAVELMVTVPSQVSTTLVTKIYLDSLMVHERESTQQFP